jgi:hypothetical protein
MVSFAGSHMASPQGAPRAGKLLSYMRRRTPSTAAGLQRPGRGGLLACAACRQQGYRRSVSAGAPGRCGRPARALLPPPPVAPTADASAGARDRAAGTPHQHTPTALAACGGGCNSPGLTGGCNPPVQLSAAAADAVGRPGAAGKKAGAPPVGPTVCRQQACIQAVALYIRSPAVAAQRSPVEELGEALGRQVAPQLQDDIWGHCWPVALLHNVNLGSMCAHSSQTKWLDAQWSCSENLSQIPTGCSIDCSAGRSTPDPIARCGPCVTCVAMGQLHDWHSGPDAQVASLRAPEGLDDA